VNNQRYILLVKVRSSNHYWANRNPER